MNSFAPYLNPKLLLIDPCDRLRFAIPFMLLTIAVFWGSMFLSSHLHLFGRSALQQAIKSGAIGAMVGAAQWAILRRYIPDARWIVATAIGAVITGGGSAAILENILKIWEGMAGIPPAGESPISSFLDLFTQPPAEVFLVSSLLALPLSLGGGLLQWLVLRNHVLKITWWIIFPLLINCLMSALNALYVTVLTPILGNNLGLSFNALSIGIEGLAYAVAFCVMTWSRGELLELQAKELHTAPELRQFQVIRTLSIYLRRQISQAWQSDLSGKEPLAYLLDVNKAGEIINARPANPISAQEINQTPIPQLMSSADATKLAQGSLAQFLITFQPPGGLSLRSCRSISIQELMGVLVLLLLLVSFYPLWLNILMLSPR